MKKRFIHIPLEPDVLDTAGNRIEDVINFLSSVLDRYSNTFGKDHIKLHVSSFDNTIEIYGARLETNEEYNKRLVLEEKNAVQLKKQRRQLYNELKQEFAEAFQSIEKYNDCGPETEVLE